MSNVNLLAGAIVAGMPSALTGALAQYMEGEPRRRSLPPAVLSHACATARNCNVAVRGVLTTCLMVAARAEPHRPHLCCLL